MLKLASTKVRTPTKLRFPKPEILLDLEQQFATSNSVAEKFAVARAFTEVVAALRIGHICKTTRWGRLNESLLVFSQLVNSARSQRLLDIGVSDGITTFEAVRYLREQHNCTVSAIGIDLHNELVRFKGCCVAEYRSNNGDPVLAEIGPFLLTIGVGASPRQPISRFIADKYLRLRRIRGGLREGLRISLINPLARECPATSFEVQNIFERREEWTDSFTIVRAANVLNREYFSDPAIRQCLESLYGYLQEGGILLVSRNLAPRESPDCAEQGSFWRKTNKGFEFVSHVGRGSCVADLVNEFRPANNARAFSL